MNMKRTVASLAVAATLSVGAVGITPAHAAPVPDVEVTPGDCAIGHAWTTYNVRLGREQTMCMAERVQRPMRPVIRQEAKHWWNPWSW